MQESQYEILKAALNVMVKGPASLQAALTAAPALAGIDGRMDCADLLARLQRGATRMIRSGICSGPPWCPGTTRRHRSGPPEPRGTPESAATSSTKSSPSTRS